MLFSTLSSRKVKQNSSSLQYQAAKVKILEGLFFVNIFMAFPFGSGYSLQCPLALRDSVGIFAAIPNATVK
jgi:hypothetical protein